MLEEPALNVWNKLLGHMPQGLHGDAVDNGQNYASSLCGAGKYSCPKKGEAPGRRRARRLKRKPSSHPAPLGLVLPGHNYELSAKNGLTTWPVRKKLPVWLRKPRGADAAASRTVPNLSGPFCAYQVLRTSGCGTPSRETLKMQFTASTLTIGGRPP